MSLIPYRPHLPARLEHLPAIRSTGPSWLNQGYRPPNQGAMTRLCTWYFACGALALLVSLWR